MRPSLVVAVMPVRVMMSVMPIMAAGSCFKPVDSLSEEKAKLIAIHEQPNHQIVHLFGF